MFKRHRLPLMSLVISLSGLIAILIVIFYLEIRIADITWPFFTDIVGFLIASIPLIILVSSLFMIGDVFEEFPYPFNLSFPFFKAVGSVILIFLLLGILGLIESSYSPGISEFLGMLGILIYPLVFIAVLILGYFSVIGRIQERRQEFYQWHPEPDLPRDEQTSASPKM